MTAAASALPKFERVDSNGERQAVALVQGAHSGRLAAGRPDGIGKQDVAHAGVGHDLGLTQSEPDRHPRRAGLQLKPC